MLHDAAAQPGYVSTLCFRGVDGCVDPACGCCCHDDQMNSPPVHEAGCWGFHPAEMPCGEAIQVRAAYAASPYRCSGAAYHSFGDGDVCRGSRCTTRRGDLPGN